MHASQTITLSEAVSAQPHGIVLVFSGYGSSGDVVYDNGFTSFFVPKSVVANFPNAGHDFSAADTTFTYIWSKRLFINDTSITGRAENTSISTNSGVTYDNTSRVLRYVIGVQYSVSQTVDSVIAQGTSGIWEWRKWESGKAECYGSMWIEAGDISQTWGGWYFHTEKAIDSYPFAFASLPCVTAFKENGAEGLLIASSVGSTTAPANMYLVRPNSYSGAEYKIHIAAKGRWK